MAVARTKNQEKTAAQAVIEFILFKCNGCYIYYYRLK